MHEEGEQWRNLETSRDIREYLLDLSRRQDGKVIAKLGNDDEEVWFCPWWMQTHHDDPRSHDNTHVKLTHELDYKGFQIKEVEPITVSGNKTPYTAAKELLAEQGYTPSDPFGDTFHYNGRFVKS